MGSKKSENSHNSHGASPGKIFIGGLAKDTTEESSVSYFERYGKLTDAVIMKDRHTHRPRGFGFITYEDPSVVDQVVQETHIINGKQVEIKKAEPKKDIVGPMILVVAMGDLLVAVMLVIEDSCHLAILVALVPIWEALAGDMVGVG